LFEEKREAVMTIEAPPLMQLNVRCCPAGKADLEPGRA
jgi:hypothetical protein